MLIIVLLHAEWKIFADTAAGSIVNYEGEVSIIRDGRIINDRQVDIGFEILIYDTVETGEGYVEVEMEAPSTGSIIKINHHTSFYFHNAPDQKKESSLKTTFEFLRGVISFSVGKLGFDESYQIRSDTSLMAVRGTDFTISMAPDRAVLVSVQEGQVEIRMGRQKDLIKSEEVAIIDEKSKVSLSNVKTGDMAVYQQEWLDKRIEALKINPGVSFEHYTKLWQFYWPRFEKAVNDI